MKSGSKQGSGPRAAELDKIINGKGEGIPNWLFDPTSETVEEQNQDKEDFEPDADDEEVMDNDPDQIDNNEVVPIIDDNEVIDGNDQIPEEEEQEVIVDPVVDPEVDLCEEMRNAYLDIIFQGNIQQEQGYLQALSYTSSYADFFNMSIQP